MPLIKIDPKIRSLIYFLAAIVGPILVAAGKVTEAQWAEIVGYITTLFGAAVAVDNRPTPEGMDVFADQVITDFLTNDVSRSTNPRIAAIVDSFANQIIAEFLSSKVSWSDRPEAAVPEVEPPAGVTAYEGD